MPTASVREIILKALAGSSSQMPVVLTSLQALLVPEVNLTELNASLASMCQSRELQTCCGLKDGKEYVCYWIPGNIAHKSPPLY